jgi:hypothetical protein
VTRPDLTTLAETVGRVIEQARNTAHHEDDNMWLEFCDDADAALAALVARCEEAEKRAAENYDDAMRGLLRARAERAERLLREVREALENLSQGRRSPFGQPLSLSGMCVYARDALAASSPSEDAG